MFAVLGASAVGALLIKRYFTRVSEEPTQDAPAPSPEEVLNAVLEETKLTEEDLDSLLDEALEVASKQVLDPKLFYDCCEVSEECECEFGFKRKGFKTGKVTETVSDHNKEVFVCTGIKSTEWPADVEQLPGLAELKKALKKVKSCKPKMFATDDAPQKPGTVDLLIFPDLVKLVGVTAENAPLVAEFLETNTLPAGLKKETISGAHVFICCHNNRDKRCGTCGPRLYKAFVEKTVNGLREAPAQSSKVFVHRVSHVGAHKYAGNVIIFAYNESMDKYFGDWYGYVDISDVDRLLQEHIAGGKIIKQLWRGRCGMDKSINEKFLSFV